MGLATPVIVFYSRLALADPALLIKACCELVTSPPSPAYRDRGSRGSFSAAVAILAGSAEMEAVADWAQIRQNHRPARG